MLATITSLLRKQRTLHLDAELDHLELGEGQLILGLRVHWRNDLQHALDVRGVLVKIFHKGKQAAPVSLPYNGRFVRIPYQKAVTKIAGATSYPIGAGAMLSENIRFATREILDLADGVYQAEFHSTVAEGTYLHPFEIRVTAAVKYRISGTDAPTGDTGKIPSRIMSRALRIGTT